MKLSRAQFYIPPIPEEYREQYARFVVHQNMERDVIVFQDKITGASVEIPFTELADAYDASTVGVWVVLVKLVRSKLLRAAQQALPPSTE